MASNGWDTLPLDEAVQVNPTVPLQRGEAYPFVDMQAVDPASRSVGPSEMRPFTGGGSRFIAGDTLMARITPCLENGKIARFAPNGDQQMAHGSTEFIVIRGKPGVTDNDFAYYLTKWDGVRLYCISQMTGTSGRQRVPTDSLSHCEVTIPPLKEQEAIACILGTLDDKIELNRRMSQTLEQMARAIFKAWFVDFLPVRAKMERRWQRGQSLPGLPAHLYDLFPARLVPSELGEIPDGWEVASLPELIDLNPPRPLRKREVAPYLDMANMPTRGHVPDEVVERAFGSGMRFMNGDTLVARITPCLENGKTAFVDFLQDGQIGWGSTEYIVLRPKPPVPEEFAYCLARSDEFREFAIQSMTGSSGRQRVQADSLTHFHLPLFPKSVAEAFGRAIKPLFTRSSSAVHESRTLAALRDALLPKLISGELRVPNAERIVGRAV
ncbi:MAG: restriction endonuclease [Gemmatales bacterium]|nr:MAG: restriction endonuclease [Gemmatales bacterium]